MGFTQLYETFKALDNPGFWQNTYIQFYNAWFYEGRWVRYFEGLLTTLEVTVMALALDFLLGRVEKAVTSEGLLPPDQIKNLSRTVRRRRRNVASRRNSHHKTPCHPAF